MMPRWIEVNLNTVLVADPGWHRDDDETLRKLAASIQRHGQLRPLVVRGDINDDTMCTLVEGHKVLGALLTLGKTTGMAVHLGPIDADAALRVALALELDFTTNFARMAQAVAGLVERGVPVAELAAGSPFDAERLGHFATLAKLDWSVFGDDTSQAKLDWDAVPADEAHSLPPMLVLDTATGVVQPVPEGMVQVVEMPPVLASDLLPPPVAAATQEAQEVLEDVTAAEHQFAYEETVGGVTLRTDNPELLSASKAAAPAAAPETAAATPAPASEPAAQPGKAAKAKPAKAAKVPKAPEAQLGLF